MLTAGPQTSGGHLLCVHSKYAQRGGGVTVLAFVLPFLLFISFPSRMWNFDGVACAAALEVGQPIFLFHSNHLLYGFLGFVFWKPFSFLLPRALPALQLFTSILSAAALCGLYRTLRPLVGEKNLALALVLGTSLMAVTWVWSIEAQVYALGFLGIVWATYWLLQPEGPRKWFCVGALHAAAILGHVVHVLWILPAGYWLWREKSPAQGKKLKQYLSTLVLGVAIPYALVIGFGILPRHWNDRWLWTWILGSAALNPNSVFQWHFAGLSGPLQWLQTTLKIFWGSFWPYETSVPYWAWILTGISASAGVAVMARSWIYRKDPRWTFSLIWLAVYGVFFWTWEPMMECYRLTDVVPIALLLALGVKSLRSRTLQWTLLAAGGLTLLPVNLVTRIQPMNDLTRNIAYQEISDLATHTPSDSIYLTVGGRPRMYLLYFAGRSAWDLNSFSRNRRHLDNEIARHASNQHIYIRADALSSDLCIPWIARYKPSRVKPSLPWLQLR